MARIVSPGIETVVANSPRGPFSMSFNGTYLEDLIPGFRINDVRGRDTLETSVETLSVSRADGASLQSRRFAIRRLEVEYTVVSNTDERQRNYLRKLRQVLQGIGTENAKLIFADEPDVYYVGTVESINESKVVYNDSSTGTINVACYDPFKYSVAEIEVEPTTTSAGKEFIIDYEGDYKTYPVMTAEFYSENVPAGGQTTSNGDCGYIAFVNQNGKVIQIGNPDETDLDSRSTSNAVVNQVFTVWDSNASRNWSYNSSSAISSDDTYSQSGSLSHTLFDTFHAITPSSYSTGEKWHGPSITYELPSAAEDWLLDLDLIMATGTQNSNDIASEVGMFRAIVSDSNGGIISEFNLIKENKASTSGTYLCKACGTEIKTASQSFATYNAQYGLTEPNKEPSSKHVSIEKHGETYKFSFGSKKASGKASDNTLGKAKFITFWFGTFGTSFPLSSFGLMDVKFTDNHWKTGEDMRNTFGANDVCVVDCGTAEIFLNGVSKSSIGAIGNQWEDFYLVPGVNQISINYSSWVTNQYAPTFTLKYRKVFL